MIRKLIPTAAFTTCLLTTAYAGEAPSEVDADAALAMLKEGNTRFVQGESTFRNIDQDRRCATTDGGQHPYVSVLSCADSRVPPELIFDAGIGELFVIRVAGNVADTDEIGTIEYGAGHLHTPLIVVMGHTKCGAVTAVAQGADVHGSIPKLVDNIGPAVETIRERFPGPADAKFVQLAIKENVRQSMGDLLRNSDEIRELVSEGKVSIVGAVYDIHNGTIEWLGELPNQAALLGDAPAKPESDLLHDDAQAKASPSDSKVDPHAKADPHAKTSVAVKSDSHVDTKSKADPKSNADPHGTAKVSKSTHDVDDHKAVTASHKVTPKEDDHSESTNKTKKPAAKEGHGESHDAKDSHEESAHDDHADSVHESEGHGEDHGDDHGDKAHASADKDKEQTLVQKHGLLVPGAFLAAGSMLSGSIVFLLKGRGAKGAAASHDAKHDAKSSDAKHDEPAKAAH